MGPLTFITGLPRSGTSMITGVFSICGAWTGRTAGGTKYNPKGSCENLQIRDGVLKPLLELMAADPLGLTKLPDPGSRSIVDQSEFRNRITKVFNAQGWSNGVPLVYKDAKLALCYRQWRESFPEAKWVVVSRPQRDVIASCLRAEPMTRRMGVDYGAWQSWADAYQDCVDQVETSVKIDVVRDVWKGDNLQEIIQTFAGLKWREREVRDWIDPEMWHGRNS